MHMSSVSQAALFRLMLCDSTLSSNAGEVQHHARAVRRMLDHVDVTPIVVHDEANQRTPISCGSMRCLLPRDLLHAHRIENTRVMLIIAGRVRVHEVVVGSSLCSGARRRSVSARLLALLSALDARTR